VAEQPERDEPDGPGAEPQRDDEEASGGEQPAERPPRIPDEDPRARERGKRFMTEDDWPDAPLRVTVGDGEVARDYAPADLIGKLAERVSATLKAFGGGFTPMLYGVAPGGSMTLIFGDPRPEEAQVQLPVENVVPYAKRIADLIELEEDELYQRALEIGRPTERYSELVQFVQSESVTLRWQVRGERPRVLTPDRAHRQYTRLTAEVPKIDRPLPINGVLYRVIAEQRGEHLGTVGIRLHRWSAVPPGYNKGAKVIAAYERAEVERTIRDGLLNESVEARLLIRTPVPGTSFDPDRRDLIVDDLTRGPSEEDRLGPRLIDDDEDAPF
jgi:hypothetical protein